jgi:hypothetical protein
MDTEPPAAEAAPLAPPDPLTGAEPTSGASNFNDDEQAKTSEINKARRFILAILSRIQLRKQRFCCRPDIDR